MQRKRDGFIKYGGVEKKGILVQDSFNKKSIATHRKNVSQVIYTGLEDLTFHGYH